MTSPKTKKTTLWIQCVTCKANILHKDNESHISDCPPTLNNFKYPFVLNKVLYGILDTKTNEEIKGVSQIEKDHLVFLSQSVIQLCDLSIGEYAIVRDLEQKFTTCGRIVWPTIEKSASSVLVTKASLDLSFNTNNTMVAISKIKQPIPEAKGVTLIALTNLRKIEITYDLLNRLNKSHLNKIFAEGNKVMVRYYGSSLKFEVKKIDFITSNKNFEADFDNLTIEDETQFYKVTENTTWNVFRDNSDYNNVTNNVNLLLKIGGLDNEISEIRDLMNMALGKSTSIAHSIISRGVLLYGSPGSGKTLLAHALANESGAYVVHINMITLYKDKLKEDAKDVIVDLFAQALKYAPTIIIVDEIDLFCPSRSSRITDSDKFIISNFIKLFDQINQIENSQIFVMAISNKPDSIDSSFRRCGRLDREIEIPTPNPNGRFDILQKLLVDTSKKATDDEIRDIARCAHGFVGSDLVALCSRAASHAVKRNDDGINYADLKFALTRTQPSAMREFQIEVPNVKWSDIGGQENLKLILRQAVEWPLKHPESFVRLGITPPRGVLMFGPPGCSKTMIAKALATESGLNFLSIKGPELFNKWVGESERAVREVFRKARQVAPSIIFFDEIDALGGERTSGSTTSVQERVLAQLLTELDGVTPLGDVTVLAATNRPDRIDKALLRPGRLDRIVYVPLPDKNTRYEIFKLKLSKMPVVGVGLEELVDLTDGYSGAEVNAVCHEAAMKALEESLESKIVEMQHFKKALKIVTPRVSPSLLKIYDDYTKQNNQ